MAQLAGRLEIQGHARDRDGRRLREHANFAALMRPGSLSACLLLVACSGEPALVFVPGAGFRESLEISTGLGTSPVIRVGEPLILHARRSSGPWVATRSADVQKRQCRLASPPPEVEPEVADNIRWQVDPDSGAVFNVQYREDRTREVRFTRPGAYNLTAHSSISCINPALVDTLVIRVIRE